MPSKNKDFFPSDDVSVSDIVENFNTDEDLPGDAVIQSEDEVNLNDDGDDVQYLKS